MTRPPLAGLWHVALNVVDVERALSFYQGDLGFAVEWRPDADNVYLTSGRDNLALHRVDAIAEGKGRLDHIGFVLPTPEAVDAWAAYLQARGHVLAQALLAAGLRLQRESQMLVPIDTGNLRASAFTRLEQG